MTIKEYLKGRVYYEPGGQIIFCGKGKFGDGHILDIADVRGWGEIQHLFEDQQKCIDFQDGIGEFIAQAIREKLEKL
jgi:hypothetical protein